jgi:hypothetical protein
MVFTDLLGMDAEVDEEGFSDEFPNGRIRLRLSIMIIDAM